MESKTSDLKIAAVLSLFVTAFLIGGGIHYVVSLFTAPASAIAENADGNWGLGFPAEGEAPVGNVSSDELKKYHAAYMEPTEEKVIYLTFDAGFENGNTPAILEALKKHHASATFFVVGNFLETSPELIKQMAAEGHTVGNHTYHHPDMSKMSTKNPLKKN